METREYEVTVASAGMVIKTVVTATSAVEAWRIIAAQFPEGRISNLREVRS